MMRLALLTAALAALAGCAAPLGTGPAAGASAAPAAAAAAQPDRRAGVLKAPEVAADGAKTLVIEEAGTARLFKAPAAALAGGEGTAGLAVWFVVPAGGEAAGLAEAVHPQTSTGPTPPRTATPPTTRSGARPDCALAPGQRIGYVEFFKDDKGYGFVRPDGGGKDVFVHHSTIRMEGFKSVRRGDRVIFTIIDDPRGPRAQDVYVAEPGC